MNPLTPDTIAYWKNRCAFVDMQDPVVRWTIENAGSVFMGNKSGELLTLLLQQFPGYEECPMATVRRLATCWGLEVAVLSCDHERAKFVVYDRERVEADLRAVPAWALQELGYEAHLAPDSFFDEAARRWVENGDFPHEVGLGLGYPAKDVLGFIGLLDLPQMGECGWCVYGDPSPSYERGQQFAQARALALACVAA